MISPAYCLGAAEPAGANLQVNPMRLGSVTFSNVFELQLRVPSETGGVGSEAWPRAARTTKTIADTARARLVRDISIVEDN
jgi:hypothetical protein